jgi:ferredoxin
VRLLNPTKVKLIYFSPTGTSEKTVKAIQKGIGIEYDTIDLTLPDSVKKKHALSENELAIIVSPVYNDRIPEIAAERLSNVTGSKTPAVAVAVYGNRAYGDALLELKNIAQNQGFKVVAGAAFIGQHSFSSDNTPIAQGRPDKQDNTKAKKFGEKILKKLKGLEEYVDLDLPGNYPYSEEARTRTNSMLGGSYPVTTVDTCILCGMCARVCPTGCVEVSDTVETVSEKCIICSACVQNCPTGARHWEHQGVLGAAKWLSTEHGARKEPETYL